MPRTNGCHFGSSHPKSASRPARKYLDLFSQPYLVICLPLTCRNVFSRGKALPETETVVESSPWQPPRALAPESMRFIHTLGEEREDILPLL